MPAERKKAFDNISRALSIIKVDIEHHQKINDLSLNIHSENFFRDVFSHVYGYKLENANFKNQNISSIDLIDKEAKIAYQITSTRDVEKVENTLKILKNNEYKDYTLYIYYLLEKPNFQSKSIEYLNENFQDINIKECLKSSLDLINDINNLKHSDLLSLNENYFLNFSNKKIEYTDKMVLDTAIKHLLTRKKNINKNYNDSFGSIRTDEKIIVNKINKRLAAHINNALDYNYLMQELESEEAYITSLRNLIIEELYRELVQLELLSKHRLGNLKRFSIEKLSEIGFASGVDFNKIIFDLYEKFKELLLINDFNTMDITWIIISYFFEICDIGVKNDNAN